MIFVTDITPYGPLSQTLPSPCARDYISRLDAIRAATYPAIDAATLIQAHRLMFLGVPFTGASLRLCLRRCVGRTTAALIEDVMQGVQ